MPMVRAVAGIQVRASSRRRATSHWPAPMTAPATRPPGRAEPMSLIRPTSAVARAPAIGKARKPAVHSSQALVLKRRGSSMGTILPLNDVLNTVRYSDGTLFGSQGRIGEHMADHTSTRTRPRGSLSRELIIKEALALLDEHGPED